MWLFDKLKEQKETRLAMEKAEREKAERDAMIAAENARVEAERAAEAARQEAERAAEAAKQEAEARRIREKQVEEEVEREFRMNLTKGQRLLGSKKPVAKTTVSRIGEMNEYHNYSDIYNGDVEIGSVLTFSEDHQYHEDNFERERQAIVVSLFNSEIGEVPKSFSEKISEIGLGLDEVVGVVTEIDDSGESTKLKLSVFPDTGEADFRIMHTYVAGTKYDNPDGSSRQELISNLKDGDALHLIATKFGEDPAVEVKTIDGKMIGYLPKDLAGEFCAKLERDIINGCIIDGIKLKDGIKYVDLEISIKQ